MRILNSSLTLCCLLVILLVQGKEVVQGSTVHDNGTRRKPLKLFAFGDSYADTGNMNKTGSGPSSWKEPYGITFPGKPDGRFSDGRVLTNYVASFMRIKTPIAYKLRRYAPDKMKYGVNFAFGGTGVFNTIYTSYPNMTIQIDLFQHLLSKSNINKSSYFENSVALVSLAGNDYLTYLIGGASTKDSPTFTKKVVNQLVINLKRIHSLGVNKVLLTAMEPLGCLPLSTRNSPIDFQECNATNNNLAKFHNKLLYQAVSKLNLESHSHHNAPFIILDLYDSFLKLIRSQRPLSGYATFKNPLVPCCEGVNSNSICGNVDDKGNKLYTICPNPEAAFFWDVDHPTNEGWRAIYLTLIPTLINIY